MFSNIHFFVIIAILLTACLYKPAADVFLKNDKRSQCKMTVFFSGATLIRWLSIWLRFPALLKQCLPQTSLIRVIYITYTVWKFYIKNDLEIYFQFKHCYLTPFERNLPPGNFFHQMLRSFALNTWSIIYEYLQVCFQEFFITFVRIMF